jgi:hypothetical protein
VVILGKKSMLCRQSGRMGERGQTGIEGNMGKSIGGMGLGNLLGSNWSTTVSLVREVLEE